MQAFTNCKLSATLYCLNVYLYFYFIYLFIYFNNHLSQYIQNIISTCISKISFQHVGKIKTIKYLTIFLSQQAL